jgi:serine/threonine-protein kinase RsbW
MRKKRQLALPSGMDSIRIIEEFSERISDEYFLNDSYFGNIITCLTEAVENAIVHGNKGSESKKVHVVMEERPEGLLFTVTDEGDGFDTRPYAEGFPAGDKGKGLFVIRSLADEVTISKGGRSIAMLFRITGIDQRVADDRIQTLSKYMKASGKMAGQHFD